VGARSYYVYIMSSFTRTLYVGITSDLERRVQEHKAQVVEGFTKKYKVTRLVHAEECGEVEEAIAREKEIKAWRREKKVALIEAANPGWHDLADSEEKQDPSLRSG
jgi:putative endonuclease